MPPKYGLTIHTCLKDCLKEKQGSFIVGQSIVFGGPYSTNSNNALSFTPGTKATDNVTIGMAKICGIPLAKYVSGGQDGLVYEVNGEKFTSNGHCEDQFLIHWDALWNTRIMKELILARAAASLGDDISVYASLKLSKSPCYLCCRRLEKFLESEWRLPPAAGGKRVAVRLRLKVVAIYSGADDSPNGEGVVARNTQRLAGLKAKGAALSYWDRNAVVNKGLKYNKRGFVHEFFNHVGDTLFVQDHADDADQKQAVEEANEGMELVVDTMKKRKAETTDLLSRGGSAKSVKKADRKPPLDYSTPEEYKRGAWSPSVKPEKLRKDCKEIKDLADDELDAILKVIVR